MKSINLEQTYWLTGYYDDFHMPIAVADDKNSGSERTSDHTITHFGSVLGGYNHLNPKFYYSYIDRVRSLSHASTDPLITAENHDYFTTDNNKLTVNRGIHEWITVDIGNTDGSYPEYQSFLSIPTSFCANRHKWGGSGTEGYLRFTNSFDSFGNYYAPTGDIDPTLGGDRILSSQTDLGTQNLYLGSYGRMITENLETEIKHNFFTGVYTGERPQSSYDKTLTRPEKYLFEVKSPSGTNFMVNSLYNDANSTGTTRLLTYDGNLRFRGIGEMFHLRISAHQIGDWQLDKYVLKIGYDTSAVYDTTADDFSSTGVLASIDITLANLGLVGVLDKWDGATENNYDANLVWADIFVYFDFDALTWEAYANDDTVAFDSGAINGAITFTTAKGWSLDAIWTSNGTENCVVLDTLIDRVAVCFPLNWRLGGTYPPPVKSMTYSSGADKTSSMAVEILDDLNEYSLSALTTGSSASEWRLISFIGNYEERPIWYGFLESIQHNQDSKNLTLSTRITAQDSSFILDRVLPIWETGQNAHFSLNQHISMDSTNSKRQYDTNELLNTMLFGAHYLTIGNNSLGFNYWNEDESGNLHTKDNDARTHLYNGQTIQMYVNEDEYGPSNVEKFWEGMNNTSWGLHEVYAIGKEQSTGNFTIFLKFDKDKYTEPTWASASDNTVTISSYNGLSASDTITLEGSQGYDTTYTIDSIVVQRRMSRPNGSATTDYINVNDEDYTVKIITTTTWSAVAGDELFRIDTLYRGYTQPETPYATQLTDDGSFSPAWNSAGENPMSMKIELASSDTHSLEVGDWIIMPDGFYDTTDNRTYYASVPLQVISAINNTEFQVLAPYDILGASETQKSASTLADSTYITKTSIFNANPNATEMRIPKSKPIIYETHPTTNAVMERVKHRTIHARWMRDLVQSPFFRAQFGIIEAIPYWRAGQGSALNHIISPNMATAHPSSLTGYNSDGTCIGWEGLDTSYHALAGSNQIDSTQTTLRFDECGLWYYIKKYNMEDTGIVLELLDTETNDCQYVIANGVTDPSVSDTVDYDKTTELFTITGSATVRNGDIVIHEGFKESDLNGVFQVVSNNPSTAHNVYSAQKIFYEPMIDEFAYVKNQYQGNSQWTLGSAHYFNDPDAIKVNRVDVDFTNSSSAFKPLSQTGATFRKGSIDITGVKGIKKTFDPSKTIYTLRKINESNGYKHCYVLWADMRNDGTANADGGERVSDFGIILPTSKNYKVNVSIADQFDQNGNPDIFTELKIGEDVDLWQFDANTEPFTGSTWSSLDGCSNYEQLDDRYHNWENKGGSFLVVDASRFYNLNTMATGGRSGYSSGGLVDFGDYVLAIQGFPYLTDAYYKASISSYKNIDTFAGIDNHPNALYMLNDKTILTQDVSLLDTTIYVDDNSLFDTSGTGAIICQTGEGRSQEDLIYYYSWTGKGTDATLGDKLTGVYITSFDPESIVDINTINTLLTAERSNITGNGQTPSSRANIVRKTETNPDGVFQTVLVYNTPSAIFPLRLSVNIEGLVKSKNIGTYYSHDKMRSMFSLAFGDTWATNTNMPCSFYMPKTRHMLKEVNDSNEDDFGSMFDGRNMSMMNIAKNITEKDGSGGTHQTTFSWLMDRDNIFTIRQRIPSGLSFDRTNLLQSNMTTKLGSQITNVRVYYNGNSNFADFPEPTENAITRWRTLQYPNIFNRDEALALAKQEYLREKDSNVAISAEVLLGANEQSKMLTGGRYGYVQDSVVRLYDYNRKTNASWSSIWGGFANKGIEDYRDSNNTRFRHASATDADFTIQSTNGSTTGAGLYAIPQDDTLANNGILVKRADGVAQSAVGVIDLLSGTGTARYDSTGNGVYGAVTTLTTGWQTLTDVTDGGSISIFCETGFSVPTATVDIHYAYGLPRYRGHPQYATRSLTSALKVMYVDKNTPKLSEGTNQEIRLCITIEGSASTGQATSPVDDTATFRLHLFDIPFDEVEDTINNLPPEYDAGSYSASNYNSIVVDGNGLYRVKTPDTYSSTDKYITFSVDYDYLLGLLRRMDEELESGTAHDTLSNSVSVFGHSFSTTNEYSAFPLGYCLDGFSGAKAHNTRGLYYAPRLCIVDDLVYQPATTISFTDTHIDLTSETLTINGINWNKNSRDVDTVQLDLQRTDKHFGYGLASMFKTIADGGSPNSPPRPQSPVPPLPPSFPRPPVGGGGGVSAQPFLPSTGITGGGDASSFFAGLSNNMLSVGAFRGLKGKADFKADVGLATGDFGIIGQNRPATALSADRDIDGIESSIMSSEGASILTNDGFALAGITDPEAGAQGESHSNSVNVRVPNDVSAGSFVSVIAQVSFGESSSDICEITTTVSCSETGDSKSETVLINGSSSRQQVTIFSPNTINGANVSGNTLKVNIERKPAQGNDNSGYDSITFHSLSVKMRRYSNAGNAQSLSMRPY